MEFAKDYCWTQGIYTLREGYDYHSSLLPYPGATKILSSFKFFNVYLRNSDHNLSWRFDFIFTCVCL